MTRRERKPPPQPVVVAGRYCLRCGRLALSACYALDVQWAMRTVGAPRSGCCMAGTALVLWPADGRCDGFPMPTELPDIARGGKTNA